MRLLVTGGAGFIGSNFVNLAISGELDLQSVQITVLDKLTYAANLDFIQPLISQNQISFVEGDICDTNLVTELMSSSDVVVNFAAESHVDNSILDASEFVRTNVLGTQSILTSLNKFPNVRMLQISTDEVYGSVSEGSWTEQSPILPNSPYSASKAAADLLAISAFKTHNLDILITRCSNNYGPRQHVEKLIPKLITNALADKPLTLYGDGSNVREWIHVDDHCKAIAWAIKKGEKGNIYNIGSENEFTNIQIAKKILELISTSKSEIEFVPDRLGHDYRYSLNDFKIRSKSKLGSSDFSEGIKKTVEWYRRNSARECV
jgi:dTDP-glucose 4,6-dehydratase